MPTEAVKPQPTAVSEKKVVRVKKNLPLVQEKTTEREDNGGRAGDIGEGREDGKGVEVGGGSEGRGDLGTLAERQAEGGLGEDRKSQVPAVKRRKLSRTPLSVVQGTPANATPTATMATIPSVQPQVKTKDQPQPNRTKLDQTQESKPENAEDQTTTTNETMKYAPENKHVPPAMLSPVMTGADDKGETTSSISRKMSISEMKAQM